jgi:hypothetical protein
MCRCFPEDRLTSSIFVAIHISVGEARELQQDTRVEILQQNPTYLAGGFCEHTRLQLRECSCLWELIELQEMPPKHFEFDFS